MWSVLPCLPGHLGYVPLKGLMWPCECTQHGSLEQNSKLQRSLKRSGLASPTPYKNTGVTLGIIPRSLPPPPHSSTSSLFYSRYVPHLSIYHKPQGWLCGVDCAFEAYHAFASSAWQHRCYDRSFGPCHIELLVDHIAWGPIRNSWP